MRGQRREQGRFVDRKGGSAIIAISDNIEL